MPRVSWNEGRGELTVDIPSGGSVVVRQKDLDEVGLRYLPGLRQAMATIEGPCFICGRPKPVPVFSRRKAEEAGRKSRGGGRPRLRDRLRGTK